MAKQTITFTIDIDDKYEVDLLSKLDVLRQNEQLSSFCCQALRKAMEDNETIAEFNQKIEHNRKGILMDRQNFYDYVNKKIAYLETQLNALRYDMHTAAVLADKAFYKELSVEILTSIDSLFENIKKDVQPYPGDYIDALRWKQREQALQDKFQHAISNVRLIEQAFNLEEENVMPNAATPNTASLLDEQFTQLLNGINDIKEVLRGSSILEMQTVERNINNAGRVINDYIGDTTPTEKQQTDTISQSTGSIPVEHTEYDTPPEDFASEDLGDLMSFFGGM